MTEPTLFRERYRVIAVDEQSIVLKGVQSGEVITINNADPGTPFTSADYPIGKLIALTDPSQGTLSQS